MIWVEDNQFLYDSLDFSDDRILFFALLSCLCLFNCIEVSLYCFGFQQQQQQEVIHRYDFFYWFNGQIIASQSDPKLTIEMETFRTGRTKWSGNCSETSKLLFLWFIPAHEKSRSGLWKNLWWFVSNTMLFFLVNHMEVKFNRFGNILQVLLHNSLSYFLRFPRFL